VVVCGHTACGGVAAALANQKLGVLDIWIQPLRTLRLKHGEELGNLQGPDKATRLSELNVMNSVEVLKMYPTVLEAIQERALQVHGAIYDLGSGKLESLDVNESEEELKRRVGAFETK